MPENGSEGGADKRLNRVGWREILKDYTRSDLLFSLCGLNCGLCPMHFPCEKYENIDEFDSFVTHQNQKKDLEKQQKIGAEEYRAEQEEKIRILEWLLQTCNDGRKKTFFCVAVNLLELEDVRNVMGQIKSDGKFGELSLKERAAYVTGQFHKAADTQGIVLKLRKKK